MDDTISVVIPAYNEERRLARCLQTLADQTLPPIEVIVVDDGSRDRTAAIAVSEGARVLWQSHAGMAPARNRGAGASAGSILCFLDADMSFAPEFVERLTVPIRDGKAVSTWSKEEYVANPDEGWATVWTLNEGLPPGRRIFPDVPDLAPGIRAIRREPFFAVGGFDDQGYYADLTVSRKLGVLAMPAPGAVCFHYNPSTPQEVFLAARWIGRAGRHGSLAAAWREHHPLRSLQHARYLSRAHRRP
ncbi:MAG: glycosyltransferase family 2 protein, partial [Chloroflexi bacterium]|nr:glycosyltransferase family 2 protein [Chloroflexota bacterium]